MRLQIVLQSGQMKYWSGKKVIKDPDNSSYADYCRCRSDADANKMTGKEQSYAHRNADIECIKTVFSKAGVFIREVGNCLDDSISWIGDKSHIKGQSNSDACEDDCKYQK